MEFLKRFALCISGLLLAIGLSAQEPSKSITVNGEVLTVKSEAVIGAGVLLKGTTQGAVTDVNGKFTMTVPADGVLEVSCIGYKTVDVNVANRAQIKITLAEDTQLLDETVVVGYGTQRKITTTGSVTIGSVTIGSVAGGCVSSPTVEPVIFKFNVINGCSFLLKSFTANVTVCSPFVSPSVGAIILNSEVLSPPFLLVAASASIGFEFQTTEEASPSK